MVEQWTHKPLVVGSNPTLATNYLISRWDKLILCCKEDFTKIGSMINDIALVRLFCVDESRRKAVYF
jgi:hypothetical protein